MDAIKGAFLWPAVTFMAYLKFTIALVINSPAMAFRLCTKGPRSMKRLSDIFQFFEGLPLGKVFFSGAIGMVAPYSANLGACVDSMEIKEESCTVDVLLNDMPWLRNPFASIHAVALINAGELASGLAILTALEKQKGVRGIPTSIRCEYYKKARGLIVVTGVCGNVGAITEDGPFEVSADMKDANGDMVAKCFVTWTMQIVKKKDEEKKDD